MNASNGAPGLVDFAAADIDNGFDAVRVLVDTIRAHFLFQFFA
jgi:hypothetical protein